MWTVGTHGKELSEQQHCAATVDSGGCKSAVQKIGPTCPQIQTHQKMTNIEEREIIKSEKTIGKGKGKIGRNQKGKEKGLQRMSEWDEWDQTDECTNVAILSMSCGEKQPETKSPALKMTSEEWQVPMKRVRSTCIKTSESNRQFVCDSKFETVAEQNRGKERKEETK